MDQESAALSFAIRDVTKSFGGTQALKGVTVVLRPGRVHALVGENGAGKSTALGVLAGRIPPTTGSIDTPSGSFPSLTPKRARSIGIHAVYQELTVVPALSPEANVFLGEELRSGGFLRNSDMRQAYEDLCLRVGVRRAAVSRAGDLSVAEQQMLEILRAVRSAARVILFDEPTAALAAAERAALFRVIEQLKADGVAVGFVSHNLDEILDNADDITVFRDGQVVECREADAWTKSSMVSAMLGTALVERSHASGPRHHQGGGRSPLLSIREMRTRKCPTPLNFDLLPGEILGIAGLVGSGRTSLLRALAGLDPRSSGSVQVDGREFMLPWSVRRARSLGISLLPEDRKSQGLALRMPAGSNIAMGLNKKAATAGFIKSGVLRSMCASAVTDLGFDVGRMRNAAWTFSGGNQQKLLLGRWIMSDHRVLLADEPTRGVDVGVREQIENTLRAFTQRGCGVILVSSELEEVAELSDRILVMQAGEIVACLETGVDDTSVDHILRLAFGADSHAEEGS